MKKLSFFETPGSRLSALPLIIIVAASSALGQRQLSAPSGEPAPWIIEQRQAQPIAPGGVAHIRRSDDYLVSVHELTHVVPRKARLERDNGEKARRRGRTDEAILHFQRAVELDSEFIAARNNLALMYMTADKIDLAIGQLEQAIQIDPHNALLFSNLAIGHLLGQNVEAGERAAREAINLNGTIIQAHALLAIALIEEGKFTDETVRSLELAKDDYPVVRIRLAYVLLRRGNLPDAKSELEAYVASGHREYLPQATAWLDHINKSQRKAGQAPTSAQ